MRAVNYIIVFLLVQTTILAQTNNWTIINHESQIKRDIKLVSDTDIEIYETLLGSHITTLYKGYYIEKKDTLIAFFKGIESKKARYETINLEPQEERLVHKLTVLNSHGDRLNNLNIYLRDENKFVSNEESDGSYLLNCRGSSIVIRKIGYEKFEIDLTKQKGQVDINVYLHKEESLIRNSRPRLFKFLIKENGSGRKLIDLNNDNIWYKE